MTWIPRYYQQAAVDDTFKFMAENPGKNPVIGMPTGVGKSGIIGMMAKSAIQQYPGVRCSMTTHVKELVEANTKTLKTMWPQAPVGIYSAGLKSKQAAMPITMSSIQSAVKHPSKFGKQNLIFIDEAHLVGDKAESSYLKFINALKESSPNLTVIGLSATAWRPRMGLLTEGPIFDEFSHDVTGREAFLKFIDEAYLAPLVAKHTSFRYDTDEVKLTAGEFNQRQLHGVVDDDAKTQQAIIETLDLAGGRRSGLFFCSGIEHIENVKQMLLSMGETATSVHSKMTPTERDDNLEAYKAGHYRWMCSDGILTTGFDHPMLDVLVLLRPTRSSGLHVQMLGRGTRPFFASQYTPEQLQQEDMRHEAIFYGGKKNCLVLDYGGNLLRLGPINDPQIPSPRRKGPPGVMPVKICPECGCYNHAAATICEGVKDNGYDCTHEFPRVSKLDTTASTASPLAGTTEPVCNWYSVDRVEYETFRNAHAPQIMKVKYFAGLLRFSELVCIEHDGYASKVAREWWRLRTKHFEHFELPTTTKAGMHYIDALKVPTHVYVQINLKVPKIINISFNGIPNAKDFENADE